MDFGADLRGRIGPGPIFVIAAIDDGVINGIVDDIGKAVFDSLRRCHERLCIHQLLDIGTFHASACFVNVGERRIELLEQTGGLTHIVAIADHQAAHA